MNADLIYFNPESTGEKTQGTFSQYVIGKDIELESKTEGISSAFFDESTGITSPILHISTYGNFNVTGINGSGEDIFSFVIKDFGGPIVGKYNSTLLLDGSNFGIPKNALDGFSIHTKNTDTPSAPTGLSADGGNGVVSLDWNDNPESGIEGYRVKRGTAPSGPYSEIGTVQRSNFMDTAVQNGTTYCYVVTAFNKDQAESPPSPEVKATPGGSEPTEKRIAFDGFEGYGWSGGTGWASSSWIKTGNVKKSKKAPFEGKKYARLVTGNAKLERSVNLSKTVKPRLRFSSRSQSFEKGDEALVKVSADGTTYVTLMALTAEESNNTYRVFEAPLSDYAKSSSLLIVFEAKMNNKKDYWFIDSIEIVDESKK